MAGNAGGFQSSKIGLVPPGIVFATLSLSSGPLLHTMALLSLLNLLAVLSAGAPTATAASPLAAAAVVAIPGLGSVRGVATHDARSFYGIPYGKAPTGTLRWRPPLPAPPFNGEDDVNGEDTARGDDPDSSARAPHHPFDATAPGPACFQSTPAIGAPLSPAVALSEDCLSLSVFTPGLNVDVNADVSVNVNVNPATSTAASAASTAADTAAGNATTSTSSQATGLPVIVWIHGGSYTGGGSYEVRRDDRMRVPYCVCVCLCLCLCLCLCCARCADDCWRHSL